MTDVIESCGGSQCLIRILIWLGVCASIETHRRYVQYQVQRLRKEGPMKECPEDTLTIFSADNLDYIHSFSRAYCEKQQSSWHGITVQAIRPQPIFTIKKDAPERIQHVEAMPTPSNTHVCLI